MITRRLSSAPDVMAPDGSEVRLLATTSRGSMAHFTLPSGKISVAVAHNTVEEVWFFTTGQGRMWRKQGNAEETVDVFPGVSVSISTGTHFQFRNDGDTPLEAVGMTMPPWPGMDEAYEVKGKW